MTEKYNNITEGAWNGVLANAQEPISPIEEAILWAGGRIEELEQQLSDAEEAIVDIYRHGLEDDRYNYLRKKPYWPAIDRALKDSE